MNATTRTLGLAFALSLAVLGAACGPPPPPQDATGAASATPAASGAPSAGPAATPSSTAAAGPGVTAPPASGTPVTGPAPAAAGSGANTPVGASKYIDDVKKIGIDLKKTTDLEKIGLSEKKKLMPFFVKSLGYEGCNGCHVDGDFKQVTRNMKITRGMWKNFVVALRDEKGGAVFCDSCHQGKPKNLARADKKAVEKFMESDYVGKFTRADKKDNGCTSCHGDEMEYKIIEKIWKIAAK